MRWNRRLPVTTRVVKMLSQHVRKRGLDPRSQVTRREPASLTGVVHESSDTIFRVGFPQPLLFYSFVNQTKILGAPLVRELTARSPGECRRWQMLQSLAAFMPKAWVGILRKMKYCQQKRSHLGMPSEPAIATSSGLGQGFGSNNSLG